MNFTEQEQQELRNWIKAKGLSNVAAAELFKVREGSIRNWLNGEGVRPSQRDLVLSTIRQKPQASTEKASPAEIRPSLRPLYARLCELEDSNASVLPLLTQLINTWLNKPAAAPGKPELVAEATQSRKTEPPPRPEPEALRFPQLQVSGAQTPYWESAAAGAGGFMEAGEPLEVRIRGWERDNSIGLVRITGDSMEPSIQDGDLVVCRPLASPLLLGPGQGVPMTVIRAEIPSGQMALISLDEGHSVTCKRLVYRGNDEKWGLWIFADNESAPGFPRLLKKTDTLAIYARVLGVADSEATE